MNFFITGKPGIGKTTLVRTIIDKTDLLWCGFYTKEIGKMELVSEKFKTIVNKAIDAPQIVLGT